MSPDCAEWGVGSYKYSGLVPPIIPYLCELGDAARFANWLNNGQRSAHKHWDNGNGYLHAERRSHRRRPECRDSQPRRHWFIPTEHEWYKSAYYQPAAKGATRMVTGFPHTK